MTTASGPLAGLTVLDLSTIVSGGTATSMLADFGARVIKVEHPKGGDPLRSWGPFAGRPVPLVEDRIPEQAVDLR